VVVQVNRYIPNVVYACTVRSEVLQGGCGNGSNQKLSTECAGLKGLKEDTFATGDLSSREECQIELIGKRKA